MYFLAGTLIFDHLAYGIIEAYRFIEQRRRSIYLYGVRKEDTDSILFSEQDDLMCLDVDMPVVERDNDPVVKLSAVIEYYFEPGDFANSNRQAND